MLRMSLPVAVLLWVGQVVLGIADGIRHVIKEYRPLEDLRTYRTWRKNNVV